MISILRIGIIFFLILLLLIKITNQFLIKQIEKNELIKKIWQNKITQNFIQISPVIFLSLFFIIFCLIIKKKIELNQSIKEKNSNNDSGNVIEFKGNQTKTIIFLLLSILSFLLLAFLVIEFVLYFFKNQQFLENKKIFDQLIIFFENNNKLFEKIAIFVEKYEMIFSLLLIAIESFIVIFSLLILIIDLYNLHFIFKENIIITDRVDYLIKSESIKNIEGKKSSSSNSISSL